MCLCYSLRLTELHILGRCVVLTLHIVVEPQFTGISTLRIEKSTISEYWGGENFKFSFRGSPDAHYHVLLARIGGV
jgi:hypothetical protein